MLNSVIKLATLAWLGVLAIGPAPALANKANDTLVLAWERDLQSLDYYNVLESTGLTLAINVWDMLVYADIATGDFKPLLAESWEWKSPMELRFKLRQGVKFHNGETFNADDVVYTVAMVTNKDSKVINQQMVSWIDRAEKIDDYTVSIFLKKPFAAALEYLATGVPIYPNEYHAKVGAAGMATKPIGTGPYKVASFEAGKKYTLEKNNDYWPGSPKGKPKIGRVELRTLKDGQLRVAELMSGNADLLWQVPIDEARQLGQMPNLVFTPIPTLRTQFLVIEPNGLAGPHPLTKLPVRQAIAHAINRDAIVANLLSEGSKVSNLICYEGQFGCRSDFGGYGYDPAKARELLAKAGYPNGFTVEMWETADRNLSDAIIGDLRAVGINVKLRTVVWPAMYDAWISGQSVLAQSSTTHWSIKDVSITMSAYFGGNPQDTAKDPEVHALIHKANGSIDPEERKTLYSKAIRRIVENLYWVPLWTKSNSYVHSAELNFKGSFDEILRFYDISWK